MQIPKCFLDAPRPGAEWPIHVFARIVAVPQIRSDGVRHIVRWKEQDRLKAGQPLRLRFHLKSAKLYSFRTKSSG